MKRRDRKKINRQLSIAGYFGQQLNKTKKGEAIQKSIKEKSSSTPAKILSIGLFISIIILVSCSSVAQDHFIEKEKDQNDILASFIKDQWTFEGTRVQLFLHALLPNDDDLTFKLTKAPEWVQISNSGTRASILMDAPMKSEGEYDISIAIKKGDRVTNRHFILEVQKRPENTLFVDPVNGKAENDGSATAPLDKMPDFKTMPSESGALLVLLRSGKYETLNITGNPFLSLFIQPEQNNDVTFEGAVIDSSTYVFIRSCSFLANPEKTTQACIELRKNATRIQLENIQIQSDLNTKNWTFSDWKNKQKSGLYNFGAYNVIHSSLIHDIFHGMENNADQFSCFYNIIDRFAGDGIRNTGSKSAFLHNVITNALISDYSAPDGNHDDLFQAWTFDAPITNVLLNDNIGIDVLDDDLQLAADTIQGFACFDGFVEGWVIDRNIILLDHPHGLALYGAKNCIVKENIVARNPHKRHVFESEPWIRINSHKDGRPSTQTVLKNNHTPVLTISDTLAEIENNVLMDTLYEHYFKNYEDWDFRLKTID